MSVRTPGVTRCRTLTPVPSSSRRRDSLSATTPAFDAAYVLARREVRVAADRRVVDDLAACRAHHPRQDARGQVRDRDEVDLEHRVDVLDVLLLQQAAGHPPGVVDEQADRVEVVAERVDARVDRLARGEVHRDGADLARAAGRQRRRLIGSWVTHAGEDGPHGARGELGHDGLADAAIGPGDEADRIPENHGIRSYSRTPHRDHASRPSWRTTAAATARRSSCCTAWAASGTCGSPVIERIRAEREIVDVDLPGFGASAALPDGDDVAPAGLAASIGALVDALGPRAPARRRQLAGRMGRAGDGAAGSRRVGHRDRARRGSGPGRSGRGRTARAAPRARLRPLVPLLLRPRAGCATWR